MDYAHRSHGYCTAIASDSLLLIETVYTDAVSFATASVSTRLYLSFTRHRFKFVIRTRSFRKRFQKWSVFKTIRFHWSRKRWNRIDLKTGLKRNWLARKVSCSMRFPGHETVSIGNRVRINATLNQVIIISILLSLFMTTAIYILPSKSYEKTFRTN